MPANDPRLEMGQEHLFAQIWTRPGLTIEERRLISLSIASSPGSTLGFAAHLCGALESGDLSENELWEWLIHFTQYAGYLKAAPVWAEYPKLLAERGSMPLPVMGVAPGPGGRVETRPRDASANP
jgi:alkylhydroperoxidase/carboxymuconolactone decarboxylase family protein YurZ